MLGKLLISYVRNYIKCPFLVLKKEAILSAIGNFHVVTI